jgi:hypothetical protein
MDRPHQGKRLSRTGKRMRTMQVISFRDTAMFKRGVWFSAAALIAFAATGPMVSGAMWTHPLVNSLPLCLIGAVCWFVLGKSRIHRFADEVVDCGNQLKVRRGTLEESLSFAEISTVEVSNFMGIPGVVVRLRDPGKQGGQVDFLPQAGLWGNPAALQNLAMNLATRAHQARRGGT